MTAEAFIIELESFAEKKELVKLGKFFKGADDDTTAMGVRFGTVFKLAKLHMQMPLDEIEKLLESHFYEVRMGAVSIMDFQARSKQFDEDHKKALFELYLRRHDRINNWDLVDRAAPYVVGGYLWDKPRDILYQLAKSENVWERRTAIVSTYFFIRQNDLEDTFKIAALLINDDNEYIHKAVGSWTREAGKKNVDRLKAFLDEYAPQLPRVALRYAIQHFDQEIRAYYMQMKKK